MARRLLAVFGVFLMVSADADAQQPPRLGRSPVVAPHGMVATSHPLAAEIGLDVLKQGGNAVDAAVATSAAMGLMEPMSCGVGGDLFAIVWDAKTQKLYGLNASGRAPYTATRQFFADRGLHEIPETGPLSWSVPGCVDGWDALLKRFGTRSLAQMLQPTIGYAENGSPVPEVIAGYWRAGEPKLSRYPESIAVYLPHGRPPRAGTLFKNPALARTYRLIAEGGRDAFYKGEIADKLVGFSERNGGLFTRKDFEDDAPTWVDPVGTNYRGYDVWELPPNGQGIAVLQMLNVLDGYDFSKIQYGSAEHIHLFVEAKKLAYEDRAKYYADMDFAKIPVQRLISKEYAAERRKLIDVNHASDNFNAGDSLLKTGETVYLTVADDEGNMVSLIQSNYSAFGSGMVPDGLGFVLQNRGRLFTLEQGQNNTYAPHKRPFHTIIPAFVTRNGKPYLSFGVMGGGFQPIGQVQVLMNMIDFGMNEQEAGDAPRIDHQGSSEPIGEKRNGTGMIYMESGYSPETIRRLIEMGHKIGFQTPGNYGGYQCIRFDADHKIYFGASDPRKDGVAAGY